MRNEQMVKVKLTGLWNRTDRNGQDFLGSSLSPTTSMLVFKEKKYSEKSPDYVAFFRSSINDNGSNGQNTVRVKLGGLWKKVGADGVEYLEGKTSPGCYLRIEKQNGNIGGLNSPDYIAYFCGYDNSDGFLGDSTSSNHNSSSNTDGSSGNNNTGNGGNGNTGGTDTGNDNAGNVEDDDEITDEMFGF